MSGSYHVRACHNSFSCWFSSGLCSAATRGSCDIWQTMQASVWCNCLAPPTQRLLLDHPLFLYHIIFSVFLFPHLSLFYSLLYLCSLTVCLAMLGGMFHCVYSLLMQSNLWRRSAGAAGETMSPAQPSQDYRLSYRLQCRRRSRSLSYVSALSCCFCHLPQKHSLVCLFCCSHRCNSTLSIAVTSVAIFWTS